MNWPFIWSDVIWMMLWQVLTQKSTLTVLSTFNLSGTKWQAERSGLWPIEAVHTDEQHFSFAVTRMVPVPHGCPAPPGQLSGGSALCPRPRPSAQRKQNLCVMWIIRSSLTHPPGSACPSGTPPPGCTWWVRAEARTEVEQRRHTSGKNRIFGKGKTLFFISNLYRNETRT